VIELASRLDRRFFQPEVFCLRRPGELADELARRGVHVHELGKRRRVSLTLPARMARAFRTARIRLVNSHLFTGNLWGTAGALLAGLPIVVTHHNVDVWKGRRHRVLDRLSARYARKVVVVSEPVREFYVGRVALPRRKIVVIPNGVDLEVFAACERQHAREAVRREFGLPQSATIVISVGRLVPQKGHEVLIDAFASPAAQHSDLFLAIVGRGPDEQRLGERARQLGLAERVLFTGSRNDVPRLLAASDVYVAASTREGHPLSIIEAMASGLAVVATAVEGVTGVVEPGVTGLLAPVGDAEAIARALLRLLHDGSRRAAMGAAAEKIAGMRFRVGRMVRAYEHVFKGVLGTTR